MNRKILKQRFNLLINKNVIKKDIALVKYIRAYDFKHNVDHIEEIVALKTAKGLQYDQYDYAIAKHILIETHKRQKTLATYVEKVESFNETKLSVIRKIQNTFNNWYYAL